MFHFGKILHFSRFTSTFVAHTRKFHYLCNLTKKSYFIPTTITPLGSIYAFHAINIYLQSHYPGHTRVCSTGSCHTHLRQDARTTRPLMALYFPLFCCVCHSLHRRDCFGHQPVFCSRLLPTAQPAHQYPRILHLCHTALLHHRTHSPSLATTQTTPFALPA